MSIQLTNQSRPSAKHSNEGLAPINQSRVDESHNYYVQPDSGEKMSPDGMRNSADYGMDETATDYEQNAMIIRNPNF